MKTRDYLKQIERLDLMIEKKLEEILQELKDGTWKEMDF